MVIFQRLKSRTFQNDFFGKFFLGIGANFFGTNIIEIGEKVSGYFLAQNFFSDFDELVAKKFAIKFCIDFFKKFGEKIILKSFRVQSLKNDYFKVP